MSSKPESVPVTHPDAHETGVPLPGAARVGSQPIHSMTGFASTQSTAEDGTAFTLTFKSVNHRFLDLNLRLPSDCDALEIALRRLLKEHVKRGHIDVTLFADRRPRDSKALQLNRDLLAAHLAVLQEAAALYQLDFQPNLHELLRTPGILTTDAPTGPDPARAAALEAAVLALAPTLLDQFNQVRASEGTALAAELRASMLRLRILAEEATTLRTGAREAHLLRLRTRLAELLGTEIQPANDTATVSAELETGLPVSPDAPIGADLDQRLLAEAALIAERSDVEEELVRLRAHIDSFLDMLSAGGELGKRLDFLLQELNREANTMLSKTTSGDPTLGLRLTTLGLEMKTEIERAREQVQNLE